jgi:integrase
MCYRRVALARGVVSESKLLTENPWRNFTWIEGFQRKLRQFDNGELLSLLDYFDSTWLGVTFAPAFVKVMLWSWARRLEVSSLCWSHERRIGAEHHFESTGKWGITKWFRVPDALRRELEAIKNGTDFVFGCYPDQLRAFHLRRGDRLAAQHVRLDFLPENLGDWMYRQVYRWSQTSPKGSAYLHVFRKTTLQHALSGEHIEQMVAEEAHITPTVMRASYARASDEEFRRMSNGTFRRIHSSLPVEVAARYGYEEKPSERIMERLDLARSQGDWDAVSRLAEELARLEDQAG